MKMIKKSKTTNGDFLSGYAPFLQGILTKIQEARYDMLMSVSKQMVLLYWDIGRVVSANFNTKSWGEFVVKQLSKDLQTEFPGIRGFSARNIWRMKMFAEFYAQFEIGGTAVVSNSATTVAKLKCVENSATAVALNSATTVAELQPLVVELVTSVGWVQNCIILEKCDDIRQVMFYLKQTSEKGWSKLDLLEKIEQRYFENCALAQNNFETTVPKTLKAQVAWEFLDDYNKVHRPSRKLIFDSAPEVRNVNNRRWSAYPCGTGGQRASQPSAPAGAESPVLFNPCRGWMRSGCLPPVPPTLRVRSTDGYSHLTPPAFRCRNSRGGRVYDPSIKP